MAGVDPTDARDYFYVDFATDRSVKKASPIVCTEVVECFPARSFSTEASGNFYRANPWHEEVLRHAFTFGALMASQLDDIPADVETVLRAYVTACEDAERQAKARGEALSRYAPVGLTKRALGTQPIAELRKDNDDKTMARRASLLKGFAVAVERGLAHYEEGDEEWHRLPRLLPST